jgi:hypothetical protein
MRNPLLMAILLAAIPSVASAEFWVLPYQRNPSTDGMYFTWFTEAPVSGTMTVTGPGLSTPLVFSTTPSLEAVLAYINAERNQNISGLAQGSWLLGDDKYKHTVDVRGLAAGQTYNYTVTQGSATFNGSFVTAPSRSDWDSIRFIAMSDSETDPAGRGSRREWQPGALAAGSLPRPELAGSQWATKFGTSGSGASQTLRYAMTETEGYTRNLQVVESRAPNFIVMPGDLVQGGRLPARVGRVLAPQRRGLRHGAHGHPHPAGARQLGELCRDQRRIRHRCGWALRAQVRP